MFHFSLKTKKHLQEHYYRCVAGFILLVLLILSGLYFRSNIDDFKKTPEVFAQVNPLYAISDDSTGGDCTTIGTWNNFTKTCTLSGNVNINEGAGVYYGIEIDSNNITLDCDSYSVSYTAGPDMEAGIFTTFDSVSIKNCTVSDFPVSQIRVSGSDHAIINNTVSGGEYGIYFTAADGYVVGNSATLASTAGIDLVGAGDSFIYGNTSSSNIGAGLRLSFTEGGSVRNKIIGNTFSSNDNHGLAIRNLATDNEIRGNTIQNNGTEGTGSGIYFTTTGSGNTLNSNIVTGSDVYDMEGGSAGVSGDNNTCGVTSSYQDTSDGDGDPTGCLWETVLSITTCAQASVNQNAIVANNLTSCAGNGIDAVASNITIDCNNKSIDATGTGVFISSSYSGITIKNCDISASGTGIWSTSADNNVINNTVNNGQRGIRFTGSGNLIVGNTTSNNTFYGIDLLGSSPDNNEILYNVANGNGYFGIACETSNCEGNTIKGNYLENNTDGGILLEDDSLLGETTGNTITKNIIINDGVTAGTKGIELIETCTANIITGNIITGHTADGVSFGASTSGNILGGALATDGNYLYNNLAYDINDANSNSGDNNICSLTNNWTDTGEISGCTYQDSDGDGVIGLSDNCPNHYNPTQTDTDVDGIGDVCEGWVYPTTLNTDPIKAWGANSNGQLGDGITTTNKLTPISVLPDLTSGNVLSVKNGNGEYACALTRVGSVLCWGDNTGGQLGDGTKGVDRPDPVLATGLTEGISDVSLGRRHTCALTDSGGVKCWGKNTDGQLGDGTTTERLTPVDVCDVGETAPCSNFLSGVQAISTGLDHSCAVTNSGDVKCWGRYNNGQLGNGATADETIPIDVCDVGETAPCSSFLTGVQAITAGGNFTCALTNAGGVKCWGENQEGETGNGTFTLREEIPVDVCATGETAPCSSLLTGVQAISGGYWHICALMNTSDVKCWGANWSGQVGDGTFDYNDINIPNDVCVDIGCTSNLSNIQMIAIGEEHSCALTDTGGVKCWGYNDSGGQLGDGGILSDSTIPIDVTGLTSGVRFISASISNSNFAILGTDADRDGVDELDDNCPNHPNTNQADANSDGTGDACTGGSTPPPPCPGVTTRLENLRYELVTQSDGNTGAELNWNTIRVGSGETVTVYRGLGSDVRYLDQMRGVADVPSAITTHTDVFTKNSDYGKTYSYAIIARNSCGNNSDTVFLSPVNIPEQVVEGDTITLNVDIKVKIKEVRDELLLDRITHVLVENGVVERTETEQVIETDLTTKLTNEGLINIDPSTLTSVSDVESNLALKTAVLEVPDIENLIKGHSETLLFEVWNPGDRVSSVYSKEFTTNIFGEAQISIPNFVTGTYDFTIKLPKALRHTLPSINVITSQVGLDFSEAELRFGDWDQDGQIDLDDIQFISTDFETNPEQYDIDESGVFDLMDVFKMLENWGVE